MRCFVAIEIPDAVTAAITAASEPLRSQLEDVRWVKPHNLHLTLRFLGEIDDAMAKSTASELRRRIGGHERFTLALSGFGAFPSPRRPSVLWAGIEASDVLSRLQSDCEAAVGEAGAEPEKKSFRPHVTIGRVRRGKKTGDIGEALSDSSSGLGGVFPVDRVVLVRSTLAPSGSIYETLDALALR